MELTEFSALLDEKLAPINSKLASLEAKVDILTTEVKKILAFVPTGNEDVIEKVRKSALQKA